MTGTCRVCQCTEEKRCDPPCEREGPVCSTCMGAIYALGSWRERAHKPNRKQLLREFEAYWIDPFIICSRVARGGRP